MRNPDKNNDKLDLYYIEWCDAITSFDGWVERETILEWGRNENWIIRQAGYILEENDKYIILASKYNPQEDSEDKFSEITKIPTTWIIEKKKLISF